MLNLYPIQKVDFEENNGLVILHYKNQKPNFIEKIFFKKQLDKIFKIDLDKIGSFVWRLCDGKNTVQEIINKLEADFEEEVVSAEERVQLFVTQMQKNNFINLYEKR